MTKLWRIDYDRGDYVFFTYTADDQEPTEKRLREIFMEEWEIYVEPEYWCDVDISDWGIIKPGMYLIPTNTE